MMTILGQRSTAGTEMPVLLTRTERTNKRRRRRRRKRRRTTMKSRGSYGIDRASGVLYLRPSRVSARYV